jgi:hypothetical protein
MSRQRVRIIRDEDPQNPRDWYSVGRLICWHSRYNLGDDHDYDREDFLETLACEAEPDFSDRIADLRYDVLNSYTDILCELNDDSYADNAGVAERQIEERIKDEAERIVFDKYLMLPVYMYDHSGIALNTTGFACGWDSGFVGWIFCERTAVDEEFGGDTKKAMACLSAEVEIYSHYVSGDVWGYVLEEENGIEWECVDSCWGFYGSDVRVNGMADYLPESLLDSAEVA